MKKRGSVAINQLPTGVPGLDVVLGGGLPEFSFNVLAGAPGSGKTTLAQQILFTRASPERPALYFTVLGEPPLKMLRYQQQFEFFDFEKAEHSIRFLNLSDEVMQHGLGGVLERIVREVETTNPSIVVVDSFRTMIRKMSSAPEGELELQSFVQRLALHLTSWEATTFLVGEYELGEVRDNPVFTVADGLFWLTQTVERHSVVRRFQVVKLRGQASIPGLHTFRMSDAGIQVFPRTFGLAPKPPVERSNRRVSTGIPGLDEMLGGGFPAGDSALVAGPAGSGKTALCTQFIAEGVKQNEPGVIAVFEEHPTEYISRAETLGVEMKEMIRKGLLQVLYLRPLDLSVDETLQALLDSVEQLGAKRVVIDSLHGFELALAPPYREDFRESLYRLLGALTGRGISVLSTVEVTDSFHELRFSPHQISFLTDDIILQRFVELEGQLRKVIMVVKTRRGGHSPDLRLYEVTPNGIMVGQTLHDYQGILTGAPRRLARVRRGLTLSEEAVLEILIAERELSLPELAQRSGLRRGPLRTQLARLVALEHVVRAPGGSDRYRPAPQPSRSVDETLWNDRPDGGGAGTPGGAGAKP
ncbi:MAG: Circadian clock protein KaiC [Armatimonadetes bacterium]|jgi:circadian clock protein KaiC|nr:Circadian clock protein KaiC [Armatimonadota bacterium]